MTSRTAIRVTAPKATNAEIKMSCLFLEQGSNFTLQKLAFGWAYDILALRARLEVAKVLFHLLNRMAQLWSLYYPDVLFGNFCLVMRVIII